MNEGKKVLFSGCGFDKKLATIVDVAPEGGWYTLWVDMGDTGYYYAATSDEISEIEEAPCEST